MTDTTNSKSPALDVRTFDKEIATAVSDVNKAAGRRMIAAPKTNAPPEYRFVELTEANCEALLEAANQQLTIAQNNLKATERYVEEMRREAKQRWEEHEAYVKALEDFGHRVLEANETFRKSNGRR
jgi:hypothetical protein